MDYENANEMTQSAAKLMNWGRELAVMTDVQINASVQDHSKKKDVGL